MAKGREYLQITSEVCLTLVLLFFRPPVMAQPAESHLVDFKLADSIASIYQGENLNNLPVLAYKLTASLPTQVEKFRSIYRWVFENIDYDYSAFLKNKKMRKKHQKDVQGLKAWNAQFRTVVFDKLLHKQRTVCTGYAYLVSELANLANIECKIIDGYGRTINANINEGPTLNHSWNVVKLKDQWFVSDPTWANVEVENTDGRFKKTYNDGYFLPAPELFAKNHYPLDTGWMLLLAKPTLQEFLTAPIVYRGAFNHRITPISPTSMTVTISKGEAFNIELKKHENTDMNHLNLQISHGKANQVVTPQVTATPSGNYVLTHTFKSSGKYDVHVMKGVDYLLTYTVVVKNSK